MGFSENTQNNTGLQPDENEIRDFLSQQLHEWEEEGIDVTSLRKTFDKPIATVVNAFEDFEFSLTQLNDLRELVELYSGLGVDERLKELRPLLSNPINISTIKSKLYDLENYIDFSELKRKEFYRIIKDWEWAEIDASELRILMEKETDLEVISKKFLEFEDTYYRMIMLRDRMNDIDFSGREDLLETIFHMLCNFENLDEVEKMINELE